jgi:hypothetical protein
VHGGKTAKTSIKIQYPNNSISSDLSMETYCYRMFNLQGKDSDKYFKEVDKLIEETNYLLELKQSQEVVAACEKLKILFFHDIILNFRQKNHHYGLDDGKHLSEFKSQ